jgi:glucose-6-phosphate 1-dehydrogenase
VAKSAWTLDDLRNRAKASLDKHGGADPESFQKLANLLRYSAKAGQLYGLSIFLI